MSRKAFLTAAVLTACVVLLPGCKAKQEVPTVIQREGKPNIVNVPSADPEMEAVMQKARDTLPEFIAVLQNPPADVTGAGIKAAFREGGQTEHMWVTRLTYENKTFQGVLVNDPFYIKSLKNGDTVRVKASEVSDWVYYRKGQAVGNYSDKLLEEREKRGGKGR